MKTFLSFLLRIFIAIPLAAAAGIISYESWGLSPLLSVGTAFGTALAAFYGIKWYLSSRFLKKHQLTRKEYAYIRSNLQEARKKLSRLQSVLIRVRSIGTFRQMIELNRLVRRIYAIVKREPKRFYDAEKFFFYHLDSVVELSEKYAYLVSQRVKDEEVKRSLIETKETLGDLSKSLEKDLYNVLANDINQLTFELDVAKHSLKKPDTQISEDERSLKK
ncbi:MAG TPA: 5-bromo-4-chloroindolyl phosphate hydrolysis family protein [Chondromyces sp.]|nr:5-bromo-4-chloroindolyl phosphate hydrolysis family protein [Chondromyces sp.]